MLIFDAFPEGENLINNHQHIFYTHLEVIVTSCKHKNLITESLRISVKKNSVLAFQDLYTTIPHQNSLIMQEFFSTLSLVSFYHIAHSTFEKKLPDLKLDS